MCSGNTEKNDAIKLNIKSASSSPVGVIDSGVGGISALRELVSLLPYEDFIYYGDSANAPYGVKSEDEIKTLTLACIKHMVERGVKAVVIACNTATGAAADHVRGIYGSTLPIIGMEPEVKTAALSKEHPRVLVMATPVTLRVERFLRLSARYKDKADIELLPCPGLVELVEQGELSGAKTESFISELLYPYIEKGIDAIVLGCTHYPFVKPVIQKLCGDDVKIYDGGAGTARELRRRLAERELLNPQSERGHVIFENSRSTDDEIRLCRRLFEMPL